MLNIENLAYEIQNKTDGGDGVTAEHDENLFFYLSIGLGTLSGLLLIVLVGSLLFHRLVDFLHLGS